MHHPIDARGSRLIAFVLQNGAAYRMLSTS
jgi:hypothetical protein